MTANTVTATALTMTRVGSEDLLHAAGCRDIKKREVLATFESFEQAKADWTDEDEYLNEGESGWDWVRVMPCATAAIKGAAA